MIKVKSHFFQLLIKKRKISLPKSLSNTIPNIHPILFLLMTKWTGFTNFFLLWKIHADTGFSSIFREEVKRQGFNLNTSISYTYNGKTISRGELKSLKGVRVIHEKIYRKDNKKENDITLKAYVYLPFNILIGNTTLYILLLLNIVGVAAYIYRRKTKCQNIASLKPKQEQPTMPNG